MHSNVYGDLLERNMIDRIYDNTGAPDTGATAGSTTRAFDGPNVVESFGGLRIIVSDDIPTTGSGASTEYSTFFFTQGQLLQVSKHQSEHKQIETFLLLRKQWQWISTTSITQSVLSTLYQQLTQTEQFWKQLHHGRKCMRQKISVLLELLTYLIRINHAITI